MEIMIEVLSSVELWMGLSVVATAIPGPQTRILPALFRAIANAITTGTGERR